MLREIREKSLCNASVRFVFRLLLLSLAYFTYLDMYFFLR